MRRGSSPDPRIRPPATKTGTLSQGLLAKYPDRRCETCQRPTIPSGPVPRQCHLDEASCAAHTMARAPWRVLRSFRDRALRTYELQRPSQDSCRGVRRRAFDGGVHAKRRRLEGWRGTIAERCQGRTIDVAVRKARATSCRRQPGAAHRSAFLPIDGRADSHPPSEELRARPQDKRVLLREWTSDRQRDLRPRAVEIPRYASSRSDGGRQRH